MPVFDQRGQHIYGNQYNVEQMHVKSYQKEQREDQRRRHAAVKILFLAANPLETDRLNIDYEIRSIDTILRQSIYRDSFHIEQHWAVRVKDLQSCLLYHKPDIVHFSGHGNSQGELLIEDQNGLIQPLSSQALSQLFSLLQENIRCVVLNACYSEIQAHAIAQHIDCVIGMSAAVDDRDAIVFATAFYEALSYGRDVKTAFDLGCLQFDITHTSKGTLPKLLALKRDPNHIMFVSGDYL